MNLDNEIFKYGLVRYILKHGGDIKPIELNFEHESEDIIACMNPSILIDNNIAYINIRGVNYDLISVDSQEITCDDQPTIYIGVNAYYLKTINYFGEIDLNTLEITNISKVNTLKFDTEPKWSFIGLEDARIIKWYDDLYLCGVRRDVKENGEGRMELSKLEKINNGWVEVERTRIPADNNNDDAYCEKNWMPVLNKPYTWINNVKDIDNDNKRCKLTHYDKENNITIHEYKEFKSNTDPSYHYRGNSQVIQFGDYYYCLCHFVYYMEYNNRSRIAKYVTHIIKLDLDLNVIDISPEFRFSNDFDIEFGCGLAIHKGIAYITYSEDDSAVYVIKFPANLIFN